MRKSKLSINISNFESITENNKGNLIGGFSNSFSFESGIMNIVADNNCLGGNCAIGCGSGPVLGANTGCNGVAGCHKQI